MSPQLTDPGEWLKQQGNAPPPPTDPGEWLASQAPVPGMEKLGGTPPAAPKPPLSNELKPEDQQDDSFWTSPHGLIRSGLRQAVHGVETGSELGLDPKLKAASEVIRGLGKAATPAAIPLAVANPVTTATALAGGYLGGKAGKYAAQNLEAGPGGQALGEDLGNLAGGAAGGLLGEPVVAGMSTAYRKATDLRPDVAIEKIWRPAPADSDFPQVTQDAVADVKTYGGTRVRTNADVKVAADQTIQALQSQLDQWLTQARTRGTRVSGNDIVRATHDAIPETMWLEDPAGAKGLVEQARQAYGGKQFTTDQFRQYLKEKNAGSAGFYGKSEARQQTGVTGGTPEAVEKIQGDAIRETLYRALDPQGNGAGPREIQTRTGQVYDLRNAADRRMNAITGEKTVSGAQTMQRLAGIPGKLFHGDAEGAFNSVMNPGQGTSDPMISRLFEQTGSAPPLPRPSGVVRNLNPNRALGPGGAGPFQQGPITPDASFVRSAPAMPAPPNQRALPPASNIQVPRSSASAPTGETIPTRTGAAPLDASFARGVNAPINPKTGQPWTAEEIKTYLASIPKYAKGGIIRKPTLLSDLKTGKPTGIMAEAGPEEIKPLAAPEMGREISDLSSQLDELTGRKRRAVRIPSGTFPRFIPEGMVVHADPTSGDKIVFNPHLTSIHDVKTAVATKRLAPLLGHTHSPSAMSSLKHIMKQSRKSANRSLKPTV